MKNTFKILFLLAITLVILSLASCGNNVIDLPDDSEQNAEDIPDESGESECKHVYEEKVLLAATCQKEGITKKTCTLCKKTESVTVPKAAHVEVTDAAIAATCTAPGKTEGKHCSVCNEVTVPQETIDALGHTEVIDKAIAATCTAPGKTEGKHCSVCEEVLVLQKHIDVLGHSTVKRTYTPVTCQDNGIVEIYCTRCETIQNYETILKGHYPADHEYAQITHESIGNLCVGYKHGDKCEECGARFIAPGTYTVLDFGNWTGTVQFKFDYYNNLGNKQSASQITSSDDFAELKFDDYVAYGFDENFGDNKRNYDGIIVITEEYFAIVDQTFYNVFQQYFEPGEYTLSGKYAFNTRNFMYGAGFFDASYGTHNVKFKYLDSYQTVYYSDYIQILETSDGFQMNYSNRGSIAYYSESRRQGAWDDNILEYVIFETPQKVSKEFFEWFTSVAKKVTV